MADPSLEQAGFFRTCNVVFGRRELLENCFLDLENGRLLSASRDLTTELVDKHAWRPGDRVQTSVILDWMRSNHVDVIARTGVNGLTLVDGNAIPIRPHLNEAGAFDSGEAWRLAPQADIMNGELATRTNPEPKGMSLFPFEPKNGADNTWMFVTRTGRMGLIQILECGDGSCPVAMRYKLADPNARYQPEAIPLLDRIRGLLGAVNPVSIFRAYATVPNAATGLPRDRRTDLARSGAALTFQPSMTLDLGGETMRDIVAMLRQQDGVRICFEDLDFDPRLDSITIARTIAVLEGSMNARPLSPTESARLATARRLLAEGSSDGATLDLGNLYHGRFQANSLEAMLTQLTEGTPYGWTRVEQMWVIHPRSGSKLTYPVTLTTGGLTVEQAALKILDQQPWGSPCGGLMVLERPVDEGADPTRSSPTRAADLHLARVSATEALCRMSHGAMPSSEWELTGSKGARSLGLIRGPVVNGDTRIADFNPIIERILDLGNTVKTAYLDLDTGQYVEPGANGIAYGMASAPAGADLKASTFESNLFARMGVNMVVVPVATNRWDATPDEIRRELAGVPCESEVRLGGGVPPQMYFFQTSEGSQGILQIQPVVLQLGPVGEAYGPVRVRYKLIDRASAGSTRQPAGEIH